MLNILLSRRKMHLLSNQRATQSTNLPASAARSLTLEDAADDLKTESQITFHSLYENKERRQTTKALQQQKKKLKRCYGTTN